MKSIGELEPWELQLMNSVFHRHSVEKAVLFGSRAMNTHRPASDVDLALYLRPGTTCKDAASVQSKICSELDALTLPYLFDVVFPEKLNHQPLCDHIMRVGVTLFEEGLHKP